MKKYVFYDTDIEGNEEYDIREEAYETLMRTCCQYSSTLSVGYWRSDLKVFQALQAFEIEKPQNILAEQAYYAPDRQMRYYKVCPELCDVLLKAAGGIFEWIDGWGFHNPEDPIFYRSDGTVFFTSVIHDGVCAIMPRDDEDVEQLLGAVAWHTGSQSSA